MKSIRTIRVVSVMSYIETDKDYVAVKMSDGEIRSIKIDTGFSISLGDANNKAAYEISKDLFSLEYTVEIDANPIIDNHLESLETTIETQKKDIATYPCEYGIIQLKKYHINLKVKKKLEFLRDSEEVLDMEQIADEAVNRFLTLKMKRKLSYEDSVEAAVEKYIFTCFKQYVSRDTKNALIVLGLLNRF